MSRVIERPSFLSEEDDEYEWLECQVRNKTFTFGSGVLNRSKHRKTPKRRSAKTSTRRHAASKGCVKKKFWMGDPGSENERLFLCDTDYVPGSVNRELRDYQREGILFLYRRFKGNQGGILADDMGLGKTVQAIGFLCAVYKKTGTERDKQRLKSELERRLEAEDFCGEMSTSSLETAPEDDLRNFDPSLIITPLSLMKNWESELATWSCFALRRFHGSDKEETISLLRNKQVEIVLTTFETARDCLDELERFPWQCIIVDEVHKIKSENSKVTRSLKKMTCPRRYGLTGTPLQNDMSELWCLLDWANPGCLGTVEEFVEKFGVPLEKGQQHNVRKRQLAFSEKKKQELKVLRDQWMLRRTKEVIKDQLPSKTDEVVFCQISALQRRAYENVLRCPDMDLVLQQWDSCNCGSGKQNRKCCYSTNDRGQHVQSLMLALLQLLIKISNHIALVVPDSSQALDSKNVYSNREVEELCFHGNDEYFESNSLIRRKDYLSRIQSSGKMAVLEKLLELFHSEKDKVLIFSCSVKLLDILERFLRKRRYTYRRLDGSTKAEERFEMVDEFNGDPSIFVFLISTRVGGVGLNITGANKVVVFDPNWNPAHDLQAQDRAYRIGQTRDVAVYRLLTVGTLEENIYLRQVHKQHLDKVAVRSEPALRLFDRKELFGFKQMIQLRTGEESLTEKLLKRKDSIRNKLVGLETHPYSGSSESDQHGMGELVAESSDEYGVEFVCHNLIQEHHPDEAADSSVARALSGKKDSTYVRTFSVAESGGAVHVHENRDLVEADVFQDHITRCAVRAVKGGRVAQELACDNCHPIQMDALPPHKAARLEEDLNKPRKFPLSSHSELLYSQTPANSASRDFSRIAERIGMSVQELASKVVSMSSAERHKLLSEFYLEDIPDSAELFRQVSSLAGHVRGTFLAKRTDPTSSCASSSEPDATETERYRALDRILGFEEDSDEDDPVVESQNEENIAALDCLLDF